MRYIKHNCKIKQNTFESITNDNILGKQKPFRLKRKEFLIGTDAPNAIEQFTRHAYDLDQQMRSGLKKFFDTMFEK